MEYLQSMLLKQSPLSSFLACLRYGLYLYIPPPPRYALLTFSSPPTMTKTRPHHYHVDGAFLSTLTTPQPDRLSILLQFGDQAIALLDDVGILLVLVIRAVGLDDAVDAVDGAWDAVCGDEFGEVAVD